MNKSLKQKEMDYCYYLKRVIEHSDNWNEVFDQYELTEENIKQMTKELENLLNFYPELNKIINSTFKYSFFSLLFISVMVDLLCKNKSISTCAYAFSILYPSLNTPIMYFREKKKYEKKYENKKEMYLPEIEELEYYNWSNKKNLSKIGNEFSGLNEKEWEEFETLESELILSKKAN